MAVILSNSVDTAEEVKTCIHSLKLFRDKQTKFDDNFQASIVNSQIESLINQYINYSFSLIS